jgi:glutamate-1-semialdehyde 2,1-aminomutase
VLEVLSMTQVLQVAGMALAAVLLWWALGKASDRLLLSRAKHPSLAGHPRWSRRLARLLVAYEFDQPGLCSADGAPPEVAMQRSAAVDRLTAHFAAHFPKTVAATRQLASGVADLDFTSRYRVPFPFSRVVRQRLATGSMLVASCGRTVTDLDGNQFLDLTGSYGVNLFGYDFYKGCIERGSQLVAALGPVLGALHPVVQYNVRRLREISALEAVSFHMSGTEAVMQAVRLARYHTGLGKLVRFCGAYHGWWGDVQPGIGNPQVQPDTYTLTDMSPLALRVLETRRDIACVLVNPLQALHPNLGAPADSALLIGGRRAGVDREAYGRWLRELRQVCTRRGIVLIFDEVMMGFRLGPGGAQALFGVRADLVTYGKSVGGGLPVGVLCGQPALMQRYREDRPADICFARGTFNAHPYVMGAMHEFLRFLESPRAVALHATAVSLWDERAAALNVRLEQAGVPVRMASLGSVWTVTYQQSSRYHWMLQYYLRAEGLALSWVGTGRLIFSLDYTPKEYAQVADRIVTAASRMLAEGWWWRAGDDAVTIRRQLLREALQAWWRACIGSISSPRSRYSGARQ